MEGFTAHQASKFTGCTPRQLRYWDQIGLVRPSVQGTGGRPGVPRLYSFRDLVALRVVKSLLDGGMSLQRVRRSWEFLNKKAGMDQHLSEVKLVTDGQSIFKICRLDGEVIDALARRTDGLLRGDRRHREQRRDRRAAVPRGSGTVRPGAAGSCGPHRHRLRLTLRQRRPVRVR